MNDEPYRPPSGPMPPEHLLRPERGRGVAIAGLLLLVAGSALSTLLLLALARPFGELAESGRADPDDLAARISGVLVVSAIGMVATLAGGVLSLMAVHGPGNRERWFLWLGLPVSILQLVTFPFGTLIGIGLLFGFLVKWKEFRAAAR